jgi:hypothetical protein
MTERSLLHDYVENLPGPERYMIRLLSVLSWFDEPLFRHVFPPDKSRTKFNTVIQLPVVRPISRVGNSGRHTILPQLRAELAAELRATDPHAFKSVNRHAASYFHRPISGLTIDQTGDVVLELSYLSLVDLHKTTNRLAEFGHAALTSGWLESAYRAARAVSVRIDEQHHAAKISQTIMALADAVVRRNEESGVAAIATLKAAISELSQSKTARSGSERHLLVLAETTLRAASTSTAVVGRSTALDTTRSEIQDIGYYLVRERLFDPQSVSLRRDSIELFSRGKVHRDTEIVLSLSAWQDWSNRNSSEASGVVGVGAGLFRPDEEEVLDSVRLTDGDGRGVEHLRAIESKALVYTALERPISEPDEGLSHTRREREVPYLPLIAVADPGKAVPRQLRLRYDEPVSRAPLVRFGSVIFEHEIDVTQARTQYVDIVTPDGLVPMDAQLLWDSNQILRGKASSSSSSESRRLRPERYTLSAKEVTSDDREVQRFVLHEAIPADMSRYATCRIGVRFSLPSRFFLWSSLIVALSGVLSIFGLVVATGSSDTSPLRYFLISVVLPLAALADVIVRAGIRERQVHGQRKVYRLVAGRVEGLIAACLIVFTGAMIAPTAGASTMLSTFSFGLSAAVSAISSFILAMRWIAYRSYGSSQFISRRLRDWPEAPGIPVSTLK